MIRTGVEERYSLFMSKIRGHECINSMGIFSFFRGSEPRLGWVSSKDIEVGKDELPHVEAEGGVQANKARL